MFLLILSGINTFTVCFCLFYRFCLLAEATLVTAHDFSQTPIQSCTATITKNHRNSINSKNSILWNKISSAHHNSLRAMEFLESLDLPSLSFTLTIGDRERPPPSHPYLNDRRRQRETTTQPPLLSLSPSIVKVKVAGGGLSPSLLVSFR